METNNSFDEIRAILREMTERQSQYQLESEQKQREHEQKQREHEQKQREHEQKQREHEQKQREHADELLRLKAEAEAAAIDARNEWKKTAKIVGDIGNKFGSFTEGMAFPSMEKVLRKQFGMKTITTNYKTEAGSDSLEIDVLGLANGEVNTAVIVEVKSHLKTSGIEQMLKTMARFRRLHPEHADKKLFGIIACVSGSDESRREAQRVGLFVASIHDEVFELKTPAYFTPRDFSQPSVAA